MHIKSETNTSSKSSSLTKGRVSNAFSASINILSLLFWRIPCKWKRSALWKMTQAFCTSIASCIPQKQLEKLAKLHCKKRRTLQMEMFRTTVRQPQDIPLTTMAIHILLELSSNIFTHSFLNSRTWYLSATALTSQTISGGASTVPLYRNFKKVSTAKLEKSLITTWPSPQKTKSSRAEMRSVLSLDICWSVDCHHPRGSDKNVTINH